jgi:hypothetical protein
MIRVHRFKVRGVTQGSSERTAVDLKGRNVGAPLSLAHTFKEFSLCLQ